MQARNTLRKSHMPPNRKGPRSASPILPSSEAVFAEDGQRRKAMPTLLHVDASPRGRLSISRQLSAAAVAAWKNNNPRGKVIARDLCEAKMTFIDLDWIVGARGTPQQQTHRTKRALA